MPDGEHDEPRWGRRSLDVIPSIETRLALVEMVVKSHADLHRDNAVLVSRLDERLDREHDAVRDLAADLRVFVTKVVAVVTVVFALLQVSIALFGPALRSAFGIP